MTSLGIGALAKRAGVCIDAVRYYEPGGLLVPETRLESGYRRHSEAELTRLRLIRRAQVLGLTLKEIRELLALSKARDIARVKRATRVKLTDVEERSAALVRMQDALPTLVTPAPVRGGPIDFSVLNALGGADCNEHLSDTFAHGRAQATPA